jgi:DNA-binding transcriptional LysR family regulator
MNYAGSMDIYLFKYLERLSQTGNFSRAAKLENTSQPSFSRKIRTLEDWAGVTLVDRSLQPVRLTTAGAQMLEAGLRALALLEQERSQILAAQSLPEKYVVTFGEEHSISWRFYTNWLRAFEEAYGPILSRLRADDLPHCMRDLQNGDVDFVIAYALVDETNDDSQSIVIGTDNLVPVCMPGANGDPVFDIEADGGQVPFLRFADAAPISQHLEPMLQHHKLRPRLQSVYENSMAGALLMRARDGSGLAWLPESLIEADLERNTLVRTGSDSWTVALDIRLYRNKKHSNYLTRSIWSFLKARQSLSLPSTPKSPMSKQLQ